MVELPGAVLVWCRGEDTSLAAELVTCGADGWPHIAHLSCGEVVIDPQGHLRIALWAASRGAENLATQGQACLLLATPRCVVELRLRVIGVIGVLAAVGGPALRGFCLAPVAARDKSAPYATITSALRFALRDPQGAEARWARVRQALLAASIFAAP